VSSKKELETPATPKRGFSRRGFLGGVGIGAGALGSGVLPQEAGAAPPPVMGPGEVEITLNVNGQAKKLKVEPRVTLLDALRDRLDLTGAKRVCDRGTCGACTVIVDGRAMYACTVLAIDAQGRKIQTVEGLSNGSRQHPIIPAPSLLTSRSRRVWAAICAAAARMSASAALCWKLPRS
jgi:xanthine dehydrogenase YagT iron-sulfur-binding subunit